MWLISRKRISLYFPQTHAFYTGGLVDNGWKLCEQQQPFENLNIASFAKCAEWPSKLRPEKYPTYGVPQTVSPKFSSVLLNGQPFSIYYTFYDFLIDSHVKIWKCHILFKAWLIVKKTNSLYSPMTANVLIKFGWHRMKTVVGVGFWNFQPHMVLY